MKIRIERKLNYTVKGWSGDYYIELTAKPTSDEYPQVFGSLHKAKKQAKEYIRTAKISSSDREYRIWKINVTTLDDLASDFLDEIDVDVKDIVGRA